MITIFRKQFLFWLLVVIVAACNPTETSPTPPTIVTTITPTPPTPLGDFPAPTLAELNTLADNLEKNRDPAGEQAIPLPPPADERLQAILSDLAGSELLQITHDNFPAIFNLDKTTTFTLPEVGTLYQLASLRVADGLATDGLLSDVTTWGGLVLPIGGIVAYQTVDNIPAGIYAVLLAENGAFYLVGLDGLSAFRDMAAAGFSEVIPPVIAGQWNLRLLSEGVAEPYSFVTYQQICFSQNEYQACLDSPAPERALAATYAQATIDKLAEVGLLPAEQPFHLDSTFGDVQSSATIEGCFGVLTEAAALLIQGPAEAENPATQCLPDFVIAAGDPFTEADSVAQAFPRLAKGSAAQATTAEVSLGVGVIQVLQPINDGAIINADGTPADLPAGDYRLDDFELDSGSELGRLTNSDGTVFYIELQPIDITGEAIGFDLIPIPELGQPEVILDRTILAYCSKYGNFASCGNRITRIAKICLGPCTW